MSCALPPPEEKSWFPTFKRLRHTPLRDLVRGRGATGRLDWEHTLETCALPEPVAVTVAQVVKQSKLWRLEKAQVCDELIAHFADGLEEGESAEELVENFGDVKVAALLIRRAKKRQRPMIWHGLKWMGRGLLALVVVYAGLTVWYATDKVVIKVDYLAQMNRVALETPESERAWPVYREAMMGWKELREEAHYDEKGTINFSGMMFSSGYPEQSSPQWAMFDAGMQAQQNGIALLREGAKKAHLGIIMVVGGCVPEDVPLLSRKDYPQKIGHAPKLGVTLSPDDALEQQMTSQGGGSSLYPQLGLLKGSASYPLMADLHWSVAHGNKEGVLADTQALLGLSRQCGAKDSSLITQLVGFSIHAVIANGLAKEVQQHPDFFDQKTSEMLAGMLSSSPASKIYFEGERPFFLDNIQTIYTDDGNGDGHLTSAFIQQRDSIQDSVAESQNRPGKLLPWARQLSMRLRQAPMILMAVSRKEAIVKGNAWFDAAALEAQIPMWKQPSSSLAAQLEHEGKSATLFPLQIMLPSTYGLIRGNTAKVQALDSGLQLGIALHRHKLAHGSFPAQLALLVPTYLDALPVDPITGGPLHYRLDGQGNPIVYSVGGDRIDDGGYAPVDRNGEDATSQTQRWENCDVKGDWILWPMSDRPLMQAK